MTETIQTDDHVSLGLCGIELQVVWEIVMLCDVTFREFRSKTVLDLCWIGFEAVCSGCFHGHC